MDMPKENFVKVKEVSIGEVFASRNFSLMWLAMFLSTMGTYFLLLALSDSLYSKSNSASQASLIFAAQWLSPLFTFLIIGKIANGGNTKSRLTISECLAGLISLVIAYYYKSSVPLLLILLFVRGFLEALTKTMRETALKKLTNDRLLEKSSTIFNTSYYMGIALSAVISAFMSRRYSIASIAIFDSFTFFASAFAYYLINSEAGIWHSSNIAKNNLRIAVQTIQQSESLKKNLVLFLFTVAVFQGYHNIARASLSNTMTNSQISGLQAMQFLFISGVMVGAIFVSKFLQKGASLEFNPRLYLTLTSLLMVSVSLFQTPMVIGFGYFAFAFFFEVCFTKIKNELFLESPKESIGQIMALVQVGTTTTLAAMILLFGAAADHFGIGVSALVIAACSLPAFYIFGKRSGDSL